MKRTAIFDGPEDARVKVVHKLLISMGFPLSRLDEPGGNDCNDIAPHFRAGIFSPFDVS